MPEILDSDCRYSPAVQVMQRATFERMEKRIKTLEDILGKLVFHVVVKPKNKKRAK